MSPRPKVGEKYVIHGRVGRVSRVYMDTDPLTKAREWRLTLTFGPKSLGDFGLKDFNRVVQKIEKTGS